MATFEDLKVWQKAKALFIDLYPLIKDSKEYFLKDQLLRASLSISNNIAEGYERQTAKEFRQFLYIAKGSCGEVRSMLLLLSELDYLDRDVTRDLIDRTTEVSKMLAGFIKTLG